MIKPFNKNNINRDWLFGNVIVWFMMAILAGVIVYTNKWNFWLVLTILPLVLFTSIFLIHNLKENIKVQKYG